MASFVKAKNPFPMALSCLENNVNSHEKTCIWCKSLGKLIICRYSAGGILPSNNESFYFSTCILMVSLKWQ